VWISLKTDPIAHEKEPVIVFDPVIASDLAWLTALVGLTLLSIGFMRLCDAS
jgi:hypothetical protein